MTSAAPGLEMENEGVFGGGGGGGGAVVLFVIFVSDWKIQPNESIETRISPKISVLMICCCCLLILKLWQWFFPMIKAILFDFDGVVVQSELLHKETFLELLSPYGVQVTDERWYREFAGTGSRHIFEVLVKEHGIDERPDDLVARRKNIYEAKVRSGRLKETKGVREFLEKTRARGIKTAIVSGSHRTNVQISLEVLGLGQYFDVIVSGDDLKERKPDPKPFLVAAEKLGVKPSECVVFEDSLAGSEAARRAGAKLIVLDSPIGRAIAGSDLLIRDFTDEALASLF
jgi:HAD superfamily hydrolase (TIGR01509 family)